MKDSAPVIVYKAKADYSDYVPVGLSDDGARVVSFPAPQDLGSGEHMRTPVRLRKGYWLDRQGVGPRTAFLKLRYAEYQRLDSLPTARQLMEWVLVRKPFEEMYYCGRVTDFGDVVKEVNEAIRKGTLKRYRSLL